MRRGLLSLSRRSLVFRLSSFVVRRLSFVFLFRSFSGHPVLIAPYLGTALEPWEEFPAERAPQFWGERVPASAADESAPGWSRGGWERSARPDLRQERASRRECGARRRAAIRCWWRALPAG